MNEISTHTSEISNFSPYGLSIKPSANMNNYSFYPE